MQRTLAVLAVTSMVAGTAFAATVTQTTAQLGCRDNVTHKVRILKLGEECEGELADIINGHYTTPHAESHGDNDWGGLSFLVDGRVEIGRYLDPGQYQVRITGLPEVSEAEFARIDLDADGTDDIAWVDPTSSSLHLFYDFDVDGDPTSDADAILPVSGDATLAAKEVGGDQVLTLCDDVGCTDLVNLVRGEEGSNWGR